MAKVLYGTFWIEEDEPCYGLYEIIEQSEGSKGFHRYQILHFLRNNKLIERRLDMGAAPVWAGVDQLRIPSYNEHTVGELRQIAEFLRRKSTFDLRELAEVDRINVYGQREQVNKKEES